MIDGDVVASSSSAAMSHREPKPLSLPVTLVTFVLVSLSTSSLSFVAGDSTDVVHTFVDPNVEGLNHLVVDKNTGQVFVGGINKLYQLSPDLDLIVEETTGPKNDSTSCSSTGCPPRIQKKLTNNVNKALVLDYAAPSLISCGSRFQGMCTVRSLRNISDVIREIQEAVVANKATASTVAFIAPGPPNPLVTQVMYVGATYTANSPFRSEVPAVSSRSLEEGRMLKIAEFGVTTGTRMFINSLARERFLVNYVYGFSSEGFSYFLTTQPKNIDPTESGFTSKLIRICQSDENYYSYTEIPIECSNGSRKYNLVQAAYVGKVGSTLAGHLGITVQSDVLFAVFSESDSTSNRPLPRSALCVYSLKSIRRQFIDNIKYCFAGYGYSGLEFISPEKRCIPVKLPTIDEDFCGLNVNSPLEGKYPIIDSPLLIFGDHLTAVAATSVGNETVVFAGTSDGRLKKILIKSATSATKYENVDVDLNSPVNSDLHFDVKFMHLYVMTSQKVSKVKVQECSIYKTCWDCLSTKDPYCGWCSLEEKCSLGSRCQDSAIDPLYWISPIKGQCAVIANVTPNQLPIIIAKTLTLVVENLPPLSGHLLCAFSAVGKTVVTNATREPNSLSCTSPRIELLPLIPHTQHHFTAKLSIQVNSTRANLVTTNFTFFDCNSYSSCTECISSSFPCDWCVEELKCTHNASENCRNNVFINGVSKIGVNNPSGIVSCPVILSTNSQEILVSCGVSKAIHVKAQIITPVIMQSTFICKFNVEGHTRSVNAQFSKNTIYCDAVEFSCTSRAPQITVPFAVIWGDSRPLDNPDKVRLIVYQCRNMADSCGMCSILDEKYGCGWCQSSNSCEVRDQCDRGNGVWLNRDQTCPNPEIHSFEPQLGPWEGGTNVTIKGINLGKTFTDIETGVRIAGLPCYPYPELYLPTREIVCRVDGDGTLQNRKGPVIVSIGDLRGYSELNFRFVDPLIVSISPKYGPRSGGTIIRITGRYMNAGSKIQASIDDLSCSMIRAETNEALCKTSASTRITSRWSILKMKFDDGIREYDKAFEYVDDPTIESVESGIKTQVKIPKGIPAGGIKISVTGKNLGYIQNPKMYVYYDGKMFVSQCMTFSHTEMTCSSPTIEIPEDVQLDPEHPLSLEYGFLMDDVIGVQNLSTQGFNYFLLYPNPIYDEFDEGVKYYQSEYLTINGHHLNRACQESDVIVQIGNSFCNITSLARQQLTCRPPAIQPLPLDIKGLVNKRKLPEVVIVVGGELRVIIGFLDYGKPYLAARDWCEDLADNCDKCLGLVSYYDCGWCQSSKKCTNKNKCDTHAGLWLHKNHRCPESRIHPFTPYFGPWEDQESIPMSENYDYDT